MGIKHIGKFVAYLILAVNIFFISLLLLTAYSPHIKPVVHPVESCFGLTFPIFLVINICFFIFWLIIQKYKFALFPLVAFLLCYSQIRTYFPLNFHTSKLPENSFKVLSYNIMGFDGAVKKDGRESHSELSEEQRSRYLMPARIPNDRISPLSQPERCGKGFKKIIPIITSR